MAYLLKVRKLFASKGLLSCHKKLINCAQNCSPILVTAMTLGNLAANTMVDSSIPW